ncbi:MAG: NADH-quinone oxidoreductase subunit H [Deltaproteobacteria bacterium]|jgi:NADH-quinone oxidoreductase subunit H|nr:NADH-quinone oxidoreductase subunit H [Deltaproteobacteria bacterium]
MNELFNLLTNKATNDFLPIFNSSSSILILIGLFLISGLIIFTLMALTAMAGTYAERKISANIQGRIGPNRVGWRGFLQPLADSIKLLSKEDVVPREALKFGYLVAPILVFLGAFLPFVTLNFSEHLVIASLSAGIYYILAFTALEVVGILFASLSSASKWSLFGGMRLAAQMLAYEVPMGFCIITVVLLAGSLNLTEVVQWQATKTWIFGWTIFRSPVAFITFIIFFIAGLASVKRAPFDLPEAESELVAGFHTEYTGIRFAIFFLSEYASMFVICALTVLLFLGGWVGPIPTLTEDIGRTLVDEFYYFSREENLSYFSSFLALFSSKSEGGQKIIFNEVIGFINFVIKTLFLYFMMIWIRWTMPRIRIDQVLYLGFKVLLPFSMVCAILAAIQIVL